MVQKEATASPGEQVQVGGEPGRPECRAEGPHLRLRQKASSEMHHAGESPDWICVLKMSSCLLRGEGDLVGPRRCLE